MLSRALRLAHLFEDSLLVALLLAMVVLASGQIVLRNLLETGFSWIDPLLRLLVLWTGMIGATVASRDNRHIRIDLFSRLLSARLHLYIQVVVGLFTTTVCAIIAWKGAVWVRMDYLDGLTGFEGLPAWLLEVIIPLAFGLIALRYLVHSVDWLRQALSDQLPQDDR